MTQYFKFKVAASLALAISSAGAADAPPTAATAPPTARVTCDARATLPTLQAAKFQQAFSTSPEVCSSLKMVLSRLFSNARPGGRKLEPDKPLVQAEAEQQRQLALADPSFRAELEALLVPESDPLRRQLLEAALLHDHGHYVARDLVVRQIGLNLGVAK